MNLKNTFTQLKALWLLRYQLTVNQIKKGGKANVVLSFILIALGLVSSISAFFTGMIGGSFWFQEASIDTISMTWNIIVVAFLGMWLVGLMTELQQTELMSMDKLLHLPISLRGAFFLNYMSSFLNTTFILFVPMMIGLAFGMLLARGSLMAISIPLIVGFLFLITTLTYQLRGWLGRIMENKRNRGTVIAFVTIFFVGLSQVPHLVTTTMDRQKDVAEKAFEEVLDETREANLVGAEALIEHAGAEPSISRAWLDQLDNNLATKKIASRKTKKVERWQTIQKSVRTADAYFPPGWLPLGIVRAAEGSLIFGIATSIAMGLMGLLSLAFSYRSAMKKYTGVDSKTRKKKKVTQAEPGLESKYLLRRLPLVSDQVSAVALSTHRSTLRAPESKMLLVLPVILFVLGMTFYMGNDGLVIPSAVRPFLPIGLITMTMFSLTGMLCNQFGMDRDGFRCFMLSPIDRVDIFIGKNIGLAPLALGLCTLMIVAGQFVVPQNFFSFLATLVQIPAVYLLYCIMGNTASIYFPMGIKRSTMQPANPKLIPMLVMMLIMMFGILLFAIPTLVSCGLPILLNFLLETPIGPVYLLFSLIQIVITYFCYRWFVKRQGEWLWKRETLVLDTVANFPE